MNANFVLVMYKVRHAKPTWSPEDNEKLRDLGTIAKEIEDLKIKHKCTKVVTSRFGKHYVECPWSDSNPDCGPDTCFCCDIGWRGYEFGKLMERIGPHKIGKKLYNELMSNIEGKHDYITSVTEAIKGSSCSQDYTTGAAAAKNSSCTIDIPEQKRGTRRRSKSL